MSRVAKAPIELPANVELSVGKDALTVKGPKGSLAQTYNKHVEVSKCKEDNNKILFNPASNDPNAWAHAGTVRALVSNMVKGHSASLLDRRAITTGRYSPVTQAASVYGSSRTN